MFIQAIIGKVSDASATRTAFERLLVELRSHQSGFLGLTAGVSEEGTSVTIVRFVSVADAQASSLRSEQRAWWAETVKLFEGDIAVLDCDDVIEFLDGGSDEAGFVQVLVGTVIDAAAARTVSEEANQALREVRPDIIGGTRAFAGDRFVETVYFTSEAAARDAESKELPQIIRELDAPVRIEEFISLRNAWFA